MMSSGIDLANARVLLSNDDGIQAIGLKVLEEVMAELAGEVWVVAPDSEQSAASHSLTMRRPLFIRAYGGRRFSVDGTPTDSVLLAVHQVMRDCKPDLVISGINRGGNMGEDAIYSGTVAAAREGCLLGIPSMAISLVYDEPTHVRWETARAWVGRVVSQLMALSWPKNAMLNINIPDVDADGVTGLEVTRQGRRKIGGALLEGRDPRGQTYYWIGSGRSEDRTLIGTDLEAVFRGAISVTPLTNDLTSEAAMEQLRGKLP